ncbi:MAG: response regulator transcription factor [Kangiellaceae bacterium]|jgi:DNA-binding response OmpR family regulator|nr:response regulator transcription factor [Kangiellaceae bacterium]
MIQKILLIEDDIQLNHILTAYLEESGFVIDSVVTAESGLKSFESQHYSVVILDLTLPDEDGLVVLRKLKQSSDTPVIICSGRKTDEDRIAGLEMGANDYLAKPYSPKELKLRLQLLVNKATDIPASNPVVDLSGCKFDTEAKTVTLNDGVVKQLTVNEFRLLRTMSARKGKVFSRQELLDSLSLVNGPDTQRAIDIVVSRLRKKIEQDPKAPMLLKTVTGFGYVLNG